MNKRSPASVRGLAQNSGSTHTALADVTPLFPPGENQPQEDEALAMLTQELDSIDLEKPRKECLACGANLSESTKYRRLRVCPTCKYHYTISARRRIASIADEGSFKETSKWIQSLDPLEFSPRISYRVRVLQNQTRTGLSEAAVTGTCSIGGTSVVIIVLDSSFLGGSMGVVVGEKVTLALELAARKKIPCVAMVTSGGARIQEGVLSLMQMAKTTLAARTLRDKGQAFIVSLSNPSTGQVLGSFASMADIIFAEPGSHIGFAPLGDLRAIEGKRADTEHTAEAYLERGHVDAIIERDRLKHELASILDLLSPEFQLTSSRRVTTENVTIRPREAWEMVNLARRPDRPRARFYIDNVFANFFELHGDRVYTDDESVIIGLARLGGQSVVIVAQQKSTDDIDDLTAPRMGDITPGGFRKARRGVMLAETFKIPVVTIVDSPGPRLGIDMEQRGLASAIARMIDQMGRARIPTLSILIGEGGSEAALAFGLADRVLMLENAIYTPITPERGAQSEMSDPGKAPDVARALKLTSVDCVDMEIVDAIVPEPEQGAHGSPEEAARLLKRSLMRELSNLAGKNTKTLVRRRQKKFRKVGEYGSGFRTALRRETKAWQVGLAAGVRAFRQAGELDNGPEFVDDDDILDEIDAQDEDELDAT
ncbi:MAG: carboxyl transferase domain-containing protein [Dehalococcoidia bacterium]|jgi:acetyl-CoA carboxylase carboxyl transferase subunit beta|nr:acetyl-CoA carboxylase carboxyl transferase subunit beta [Chloroflexota bacterium]MDP6055591.1 carboxyl transferase domain-containing protein [Dehalococcoidia bacterium]MDP7091100.1 carboxyl transferase domain-containing protein [Dehalococcoidia bacterium]MDP7261334.1 carboxyl transferase domain-containing protein [Dehalococcoidia bacterium]MDP7484445.1 carboxyl transferase domain-containing protein [Dehalococcoidia bacterium]|tara:strand:- start:5936 stop:7900 length:1965 start_codon:yes stop_codon:yes gene_type:complete